MSDRGAATGKAPADDACALLTEDEVADVIGKSLESRPMTEKQASGMPGDVTVGCQYLGSPVINVARYAPGGAAKAIDNVESQRGKATIASLTTLSGIGDRAIYYKPAGSSIGNALVAKGDAGIWIQTNADEAQVRKPAAIAVARL